MYRFFKADYDGMEPVFVDPSNGLENYLLGPPHVKIGYEKENSKNALHL
jgi:hypothetical protein